MSAARRPARPRRSLVGIARRAVRRAGLAIEEARAFADAKAAARRLERLQAVTDAALGHLALGALLDELVLRVRDTLDADTCAVLLLDEQRHEVVARAAAGLEEEVEAGVRIPVGRGFAGRVAAERRVVAIEDVDDADVLNPILREKGIKSLLGAPLLAHGNVLGVIHVGTLAPRVFTQHDVELLQAAADRAALGLERAMLHERLIELDQLRNRFVAVAAHELRTPTAAILGSALTLQAREAALDPTDRAALVGLLVSQSQRLATLLEQLLDLSRLELHSVEIRRRPQRVRDLVDRSLAELAPEHRAAVDVDVEPTLQADVDAVAVERIVSNLVVNAIRHGRPPVLVRADRDGDEGVLRLEIADAGEGVPADVRARVFDQFTRGDRATGTPGSGLGLAIARSYARAHGGDLVLLESNGRGARFQLLLPG